MDRKLVVGVLVLVLGGLLIIPPLGFFVILTGIVSGKMKEAGQAAAAQPCGPGGVLDAAAFTGTGTGTVLPVKGLFAYSSDYGMRLHPVVHEWRMHAGIDLAMIPHGGTIVAARDGKVQAAKPNNGAAGNMLILDHGAGLTTTYMHLANLTVTQGQIVKAGQQIGVEGATGRVTGAHLHFEVRVNGKPTDPRAWLIARGVQFPQLKDTGAGTGNVHPDPASSGTGATPPAPTASNTTASRPSPPASTPPATTGAVASKTAVTTSLPARVGEYEGEQIRNAAHIIQAGRRLNLDDRTITLGLMTAMGESSLINVAHGDKAGPDSRGLFQQRTGWGPEADRMNPPLAATKFFRALMRVKGYRTMTPTLAAHATQRNQDPYHYAPHWPSAVRMMAALTANPALEQTLGGIDPASGASAPCITTPGQGGAPVPAGELPPGPEGTCPATTSPAENGLQPATLRLLRCGAAKFPEVATFYGVGSRPGPSEHPAGRAVDFMIDNYRTPQGRAYGWQVATWLRTHAAELGIEYVIWDVKIWHLGDADWQVYTRYGPTPSDNLGHRNHVHVSVQT